MGGFSPTFLVRSTDDGDVDRELQRLLSVDGWLPTDEELDDEEIEKRRDRA